MNKHFSWGDKGSKRDKQLALRISQNEIDLLDEVVNLHNQSVTYHWNRESRMDVIRKALEYYKENNFKAAEVE